MKISYDPAKDASNKEKHGLSLKDVVDLDWQSVITIPDNHHDYGELREVGYGLIKERLHCVVFVRRGHEMRIISFRKANRREVQNYVNQTHNPHANA